MGNDAAGSVGMTEAPVSLEASISGLIGLFDGVTKESSGQFYNFDGTVVPW